MFAIVTQVFVVAGFCCGLFVYLVVFILFCLFLLLVVLLKVCVV